MPIHFSHEQYESLRQTYRKWWAGELDRPIVPFVTYGHPSEIVIEKLEEKGIMVFRTDLDGAVGIINRKGNFSVCTDKQR